MIRISMDELGAIDDTIGYVGKYNGDASVEDILNGNINNWKWKTVLSKDAEDIEAAILFIRHVDKNPALVRSLMTAFKVPRNSAVHILKSNKLIGECPNIPVSIAGLAYGGYLFVRDRFKTDEYIKGYMTQDDLSSINVLQGCCLEGLFDLRLCSYYCDFA